MKIDPYKTLPHWRYKTEPQHRWRCLEDLTIQFEGAHEAARTGNFATAIAMINGAKLIAEGMYKRHAETSGLENRALQRKNVT